ncbi:MAG: hypothetical protein LQ350_001266 [Teloschistes chrysophthalmus]|nr:MAG: hypothetical protein LQ350_001266 [Niorma chrysophthalma]
MAAAMLGANAAFAAPAQTCLPSNVLYVGLNYPTGIPDSACCSGKSAGSYCVSKDPFSGPDSKEVGPPAFVIPHEPLTTPSDTPKSTSLPPASPPPSTSTICDEACLTPLPLPLLSPPDSAHPSNLLPEPTSPGPVYTTTLAGKGVEALHPVSFPVIEYE